MMSHKYKTHDTKYFGFLTGFTLIEITVVLAIMAVLVATAGLSIFTSRRNSLLLEQATQELAGEIRLIQSRIMSVQKVTISGDTFIPKAAIIKISTGAIDPEISYLDITGADCSTGTIRLEKTFKLENRADIQVSSTVYLIYVAPTGGFYAINSLTLPSFVSGANNTCIPNGTPVSGNITITLNKGSRNYNIYIDGKTGGVTTKQ